MKRKRPDLSERNTKHGLCYGENGKKTRLYNIWVRMKQRCHDINASDFSRYGGRGISVCKEWVNSYVLFYEWSLANGYDDTLTIEREDVNGNYEPGNCSWIPMRDQARNKRNNHFITRNGVTKTLTEWAEILGIESSLLRYRLKHWGEEKTFSAGGKKNETLKNNPR